MSDASIRLTDCPQDIAGDKDKRGLGSDVPSVLRLRNVRQYHGDDARDIRVRGVQAILDRQTRIAEMIVEGVDAVPRQDDRGGCEEREYMTTEEAAEYLRRSPSWLVRQPDVPYVRGTPNTYRRKDLDDWFERHKHVPRAG